MARNKTSEYPISGFDYRWGENKETGDKAQTPDKLPHSGRQLREFLGLQFQGVNGRLKTLEDYTVNNFATYSDIDAMFNKIFK